jgi:hypothetical protein
LTELRRWIASRDQQPPAPAHSPTVNPPAPISPQASDSALPQTTVRAQRHQSANPSSPTERVADCQSAVSSAPTETLLSEVKKEGNYILLCKVKYILFLCDIWLTEILYSYVPEYKMSFFSPHITFSKMGTVKPLSIVPG